MKANKGLLAILFVLCMAFSLFSCVLGGGDDTAKAPEETTVKDPEDTTAVEEKTTFTVPKSRRTDGKLIYEYTYSPDGKSISRTDYTEEDPITYTVTFDEGGKPLYKEWTVKVNDTRTELWRDEYDEFDEEGRITLERRYCEGVIQNAYAYTYDSEGRMDTQTSRDVKQQNVTYKYIYDEMGTHIATRFKKYNGEAGYYHEQKTCTYDTEGRVLTEVTSGITLTHEYKERDGLLIGEKVTSRSGDFHWSYYYDYKYENGILIRKDCSFEGMITDSEEFCETEFSHYVDAVNRIFRERLP